MLIFSFFFTAFIPSTLNLTYGTGTISTPKLPVCFAIPGTCAQLHILRIQSPQGHSIELFSIENTVRFAVLSTVKALSSVKGPKFGQCRVYLQKELSTRKIAVTDNVKVS